MRLTRITIQMVTRKNSHLDVIVGDTLNPLED